MTKIDDKLLAAQNNDKVVFYDYLSYKRAAGWENGLNSNDWIRPKNVRRAIYNSDFLRNLPDHYFLGIPVKELVKSSYSVCYSHACAVALSLYVKDFELITFKSKSYNEKYLKKHKKRIVNEEQTVLVIDLDGVKTVVDTTAGLITDYETYKSIFDLKDINVITSDDLNKTRTYSYIKSLKDFSGPDLNNDNIYVALDGNLLPLEENEKYETCLDEYMFLCETDGNIREYSKELTIEDIHLRNFLGNLLLNTSNKSCIRMWRIMLSRQNIGNTKFKYPEINMFSLEHDEIDHNLYSVYKNDRSNNLHRIIASRLKSVKEKIKKR